MIRKFIPIISSGLLMLSSCTETKVTDNPVWLENDSLAAIESRTRSDFSLTMEQAQQQIKELYPNVTNEDIERFISQKALEVKVIDGQRMMHRKSPRNLKLLSTEIGGEWSGRGFDALPNDMALVDSITSVSKAEGDKCCEMYVKYRFSVDVPRHDFLLGDTLKVWVPLPIESARQSNVKILSASHDYVRSTDKSVHNTIYFATPVNESSDSIIHFEYVGEYNVAAQYFGPDYIIKNIKPYDTESDLYKNYTCVELPHIVKFDSLAHEIVGDEKCPFRQSELVYDYIVKNFPWAGAREYSTIECLPQYVIDEKHGDCGQVALLYISIMRTLGVPARWESGWMLHPGQVNLHDWAEVYFEGIGWVPVDASFGRYKSCKNPASVNFYSTGMDQYRFATNLGINGTLYPAKKFVRSETVDFQMGEVECSKGNLFYPGWKKKFEILEMNYVK